MALNGTKVDGEPDNLLISKKTTSSIRAFEPVAPDEEEDSCLTKRVGVLNAEGGPQVRESP